MKTNYETLGIESTATDEEIKQAYRSLAQKYHPDKPDGDSDKFSAVKEAYEALTDDTDVHERLVVIFDAIIKNDNHLDNVIDAGVKMCHQNISRLMVNKTHLVHEKKQLNKKMNRITVKKGCNIYQQIVTQLIDKCECDITIIDDEIAKLNRTITALDNYEDGDISFMFLNHNCP